MKKYLLGFSIVILSFSCATKKQVNYLQDIDKYQNTELHDTDIKIQPKDILNISVTTLMPEAAIPYNKMSSGNSMNQNQSIELMQLYGYVVSNLGFINFPVLGEISVKDKTTNQVESTLKEILEQGGHLKNPTVSVRLINAKFTVLGEINAPGTYNFTDNNLNVLQALGLAGDLTITGQREDVLLIREMDGVRTITHIDLTKSNWLDSDVFYIKPNDVLVVNPNLKMVKSAGIIGDPSTLLGIASLVISITILLTR